MARRPVAVFVVKSTRNLSLNNGTAFICKSCADYAIFLIKYIFKKYLMPGGFFIILLSAIAIFSACNSEETNEAEEDIKQRLKIADGFTFDNYPP
jgi:hypothetical protein